MTLNVIFIAKSPVMSVAGISCYVLAAFAALTTVKYRADRNAGYPGFRGFATGAAAPGIHEEIQV
jgi:hypothetical protein